MQEGLQSDIIHRRLPAIQFRISVFSKIVKIKTHNIFILPAFCVDLTAVFSPSDTIADPRPLRTVCLVQYVTLIWRLIMLHQEELWNLYSRTNRIMTARLWRVDGRGT